VIELPKPSPESLPSPLAARAAAARDRSRLALVAALAGLLPFAIVGAATGLWGAAAATGTVVAVAVALPAVVRKRHVFVDAARGPSRVAQARDRFADTLSRGVKGLNQVFGQLAGRPKLLRPRYQPTRSDDDTAGQKRRVDKRRVVVRHLTRAQRIARVGSWEWRPAADRINWSAEVFRIAGVPNPGFRPERAAVLELVHPADRRAFSRWLIALARGRSRPGLDLRIVRPTGETRHVHLLGEPLHDGADGAKGVFGTVQEATEHARALEEARRLAYYDALTELPNRARFDENLAATLLRAQRDGRSFALLFLDLDQFKRINDTLGHAVGDELLRIIAQRLTRVLRLDHGHEPRIGDAQDRDLCRRGGDEFIVLLNGVADEPAAARVAQRVLEALAKPVVLARNQVYVSASIGIVLFPRDGNDLSTLLMNADIAMYQAKSRGRNRYSFYEESMRVETARRLLLEGELRRAVEGQQFEIAYQPQIDVRTGAITGVEALLRWNHPQQGQLSPTQFIGVAEETGLIGPIWEWVLVSALVQHNAWREAGIGALTVGVNLSSAQLVDPGLPARLVEIAELVGVRPQHVELEVTESMLMADFEGAVRNLGLLRALGIKIAIDDFGTGYSSLAYLRRLPFDKLKLDQSFTRDAVVNAQDAAITRAIVAMAKSLDVEVVAEGVETDAQRDFLEALGCTTMQGFLLARPMAGAAITEFVRAAGGRNRPTAARRDAGAFDLEPGLALLPLDAPDAPALRRH
jgi:diguanylate cyclase (GGDEF)-like protein